MADGMVDAVMDNHWTDEEIWLTRRAWAMYDRDQDNKFQRVCRYVSAFAMGFMLMAVILGAWR